MAERPSAVAAGPRRTHARGANARRLRIIAGRWRGRRWQFPDVGIRPTSDRIRETLFNWLQPKIGGRRCLDLYAGSGALGLEALSRGAAHCVFVDNNARAIGALSEVLREWGADTASAELVHAEAEHYLRRPAHAFGIVFLDPPFAGQELSAILAQLQRGGWLAPGCLLYLEHPRRAELPPLSAALQALRHGTAGAVGYDLYEFR